MIHFLKKIIQSRKMSKQVIDQGAASSSQALLSRQLAHNVERLMQVFGASNDIVLREFSFGHEGKMQGAVLYVEGLANKLLINESLIKPLMYDIHIFEGRLEVTTLEAVKSCMISLGGVEEATTLESVVDACLSGDAVLIIQGFEKALVLNTKGWEDRGVEEPKTESVVRGPREGFTENLRINTSLLRRKIKNPNLTLEPLKIGKKTKTDVCMMYLKGVVNPRLVEEIRRRLNRIDTDAIMESGYIEQFIEDAPHSIFPTVANSEKPDVVAAKILEGRAAIIVDGTPFVLTVPMLFIENFQSAEDYYSRPYFASLIRMLRFGCYGITILAPAIYVALTTFHQELIPTPLLFTLASSREGVPFPAMLEALVMLVAFEILREAGIRLPRPVGSAISIVGALIIGESAVAAGLIGAPMVIVVALTAVSSFVVPAQTDSESILRYIFLFLAGVMGGFGVAVGMLGLFIHLAGLRSFGAPYLSPLAPLSVHDQKDVFIRAPLWAMLTRPRAIGWRDPEREHFRLEPSPPDKGGKSSK
ncbi:spore germination protein KA [Evansella caseinilytica]|uniref:Spore germination protein KA n=1 Tax=Evansella caseinilytica TaxID=1503961 RepID=A0A1H3V0B5_9BACI|nr:spore germination protein [Evansella caseinilytica]SDZ67671.1 spore germination protein KA [Evansella caseinilytica]